MACWVTQPASRCRTEYTFVLPANSLQSQNFCNSPQISSKFYVYADYIIGCYILFRKLCCYGSKLDASFEKGNFDCLNLSVKFRCWSCSDARRNRENSGCGPERVKLKFYTGIEGIHRPGRQKHCNLGQFESLPIMGTLPHGAVVSCWPNMYW